MDHRHCRCCGGDIPVHLLRSDYGWSKIAVWSCIRTGDLGVCHEGRELKGKAQETKVTGVFAG